MCTDGRIRLFWGVSPDFMVIALSQVYDCLPFHSTALLIIIKAVPWKVKLVASDSLIYIYIYI